MATGWPSTDPLNLCRAIIAYVTAQGAEEAERANIPNVRIRRRKPRQSEKRREDSPKHSKTNTSHSLHEDGTDVLTLNGIPPTLPESKLMEPIPRRSSGQRHDDNIVVEDIEDEEDRHDEISPQQLHPASFLREDIYTPHTDTNDSQATVDDEIIDSAAASTSESTQLNECSAPKPSEVDPVQDNLTELSPDMVKATNPEKSSASQNDSDAEAQQTEEATQVSIELDSKISSVQGQNNKAETESVAVSSPLSNQRVINDNKPISSTKLAYADDQASYMESQITTPATVATIRSPPSPRVPIPTNNSTDSESIKAAAFADNTPVTTSVLSEQRAIPLTASEVTNNELLNSDQGVL